MEETISIQQLVQLRKATRLIADHLRSQLKEHLTVLGPLFRPKPVLGGYITGGSREHFAAAEKAYQEMEALFLRFAADKPFHLAPELRPPLEINHTPLEIQTFEYAHTADGPSGTKSVRVISPLKWVLSYPGCGLSGLRELVAQRSPSEETLRQYAIHAAVLHHMMFRQSGLSRIFAALRFPVNSGSLPEFGGFPVICIFSAVPTVRPPDEVIIESTEISGTDTFEEVVEVSALEAMSDPLREELLALVHSG